MHRFPRVPPVKSRFSPTPVVTRPKCMCKTKKRSRLKEYVLVHGVQKGRVQVGQVGFEVGNSALDRGWLVVGPCHRSRGRPCSVGSAARLTRPGELVEASQRCIASARLWAAQSGCAAWRWDPVRALPTSRAGSACSILSVFSVFPLFVSPPPQSNPAKYSLFTSWFDCWTR